MLSKRIYVCQSPSPPPPGVQSCHLSDDSVQMKLSVIVQAKLRCNCLLTLLLLLLLLLCWPTFAALAKSKRRGRHLPRVNFQSTCSDQSVMQNLVR
jgi:hypothetical protein